MNAPAGEISKGRSPVVSCRDDVGGASAIARGGPRRVWWWLVAALAVALGVRLAVLVSPLGELDADEAVVGLMARHIAFNGELPIFYYGQAYLGSLEAFSAAPLFLAFDSSGALLKMVPLA